MDNLLLTCGALVLFLFLTGVFYTVREFNEMSSHPSDYRESDEKLNIDHD